MTFRDSDIAALEHILRCAREREREYNELDPKFAENSRFYLGLMIGAAMGTQHVADALETFLKEYRERKATARSCQTCRWWVNELGLREPSGERYLQRRPDGWRLCSYSVNDCLWYIEKEAKHRKAVAVETDQSVAALATAPDYGCVAWEEA